jgi:GAF domain-containing protein
VGVELFDLWTTLLFLAGLVMVTRLNRQLRPEDKRSYNHVCLGLLVLAGVSLAKVYYGLGLFRSVAFVSDPLFFRLVNWIGVITGLTLVASGVSRWLPLFRAYRKYSESRIKRLDLLKKVEQLAGVESRLSVILARSVEHMVEHYDLPFGAVYLYSVREDKASLVSSHAGQGEKPAVLAGVVDEPRILQLLAQERANPDMLLQRWPSEVREPGLALPIAVHDKPIGLFLLWGGRTEFDADDRVNLKIAAEIIGRKVSADRQRAKIEHLLRRDRIYRELRGVVDEKKEIKDNFVRIVRQLREYLSFDFASLTVVYPWHNVQRFSVGENDTLLKEMGLDFKSYMEQAERLFHAHQPVVIADFSAESARLVDKIMANSGMRSLLALPIVRGGQVEGVLTLGARQADHFSATDVASLRQVVLFLAELVADQKLRHELQIREHRHARMNSLLAEIAAGLGDAALFDRAAAILSDEVKTTVVRIATFSADKLFLDSRALVLLRPIKPVAPKNGHLVLSLMPYHRLVRETGRLMMVNQMDTDNKIGEAEAMQAFFPDLKSALLVPIKAGEEVLGIIALAEIRGWDRFQYSQADVLFATSIGSVLVATMRLGQRSDLVLPERRLNLQELGGNYLAPEARGHIRSSLSGILGSVEMMRSQPHPSGETLTRYLSIIDRSARKITECFTDNVSE